MRGHPEVARHWGEGISTDWEQLRSWSDRVFTREKTAEMGALLATLALWAVLLISLYRAAHNYTVL